MDKLIMVLLLIYDSRDFLASFGVLKYKSGDICEWELGFAGLLFE